MSEVFDFELFPRLETERLILREIVPADADAVFAFRSDPIAQKHNDPPQQHIAETYELISWMADEYRQKLSIRWGVCLKEDDRVIGLIGYNYWDRANRRSGSLRTPENRQDVSPSRRATSPGVNLPAASCSAPVRRSRTFPSSRLTTHV